MKNFLLLCSITLLSLVTKAQTLVGISPNVYVQGSNTTLTTTITGQGTGFFLSSSSPGMNIYNGSTIYYGDYFGTTVSSDTTFTTTLVMSPTAPLGSYTLVVNYFDGPAWSNPNTVTLTLPNAFTVVAADGYINGTVFDDRNQNGIQDLGESGIPGISLNIQPVNLTISTDVNGHYSYPLTNGSYSISYITSNNNSNYLFFSPPATAINNFVINNSNYTANYPMYRGLTSMNPDSAYFGQTINVTVYSAKGIFRNGGANLATTYLSRTSGTAYKFYCKNYTFIDSTTAILKFKIPNLATYKGNYSLYFNCNQVYTGVHILNNCLSIVDPPLFMNGIVFFDSDSNGVKGLGETGVCSGKVLMLPDSIVAYPDINGNYGIGTEAGTHTLNFIPDVGAPLSVGSAASYTATVSGTTSGYNFGIKSTGTTYSSSLNFSPCWAGCVHPNFFGFIVTNTGVVPYNGYVYMILDSNMIYVPSGSNGWWGASYPTSVNGDTLFWSFSNLQPLGTQNFGAYISTPVGGVTITYSATVVSLNSNGQPAFSTTNSYSHIVNCSMDPNEKSVRPFGEYAQHYTLMSDELEYSIVFQNTGTDTAFTVVIRDTLDASLDINSMQVLLSSNSVKSEVDLMTGVAKFTFNSILLPDSNTNEARSHGFIKYRIRPKNGLANNTLVTNKAAIYFDFNAPVITNETYNTLVYVIPTGISLNTKATLNITVVPNPFSNNAQLKYDNKLHQLHTLNIYSIDGQLVEKLQSTDEKLEIHSAKMNSGLYLFELVNQVTNEISRGRFVVEK